MKLVFPFPVKQTAPAEVEIVFGQHGSALPNIELRNAGELVADYGLTPRQIDDIAEQAASKAIECLVKETISVEM